MKSKIKKISSILAISSCLLFTACGEEETIAPIEESTTESTMESTIEVVEESEELTESSNGMSEMESEDIQSEAFIVEDIEPTTMYVTEQFALREGPNAEDFAESAYVFEGDAVSDAELQAALDAMMSGGNKSQFSTKEELTAYLESVADTGEIVTIDGRTGMIVSEVSSRGAVLYSMVDETGDFIFGYGDPMDGGIHMGDGNW